MTIAREGLDRALLSPWQREARSEEAASPTLGFLRLQVALLW
jgi:hypothetical protein